MYCGYVEGGEDFYLKIMWNEAPFKEIALYKNKCEYNNRDKKRKCLVFYMMKMNYLGE